MSRHPLVRAVAKALRTRCGVGEGAAIVVGVSGGADSVALLRALAALAPRRRWRLRLVVGHVQHHLRDEAEAEAAFVAELAQGLGLPFVRRDIAPAAEGANLEAAARRLRYAALQAAAAEHDCEAIAVGHHGDDQLETLLMRLMRGAGPRGMRGMAWRRSLGDTALIRPMLGVTHADAVDLLQQVGQPWREDATNADRTRTRARLRAQVLPVLRELRPDVAEKSQRLAEHCQRTVRNERRAGHVLDRFITRDGSACRVVRAVIRSLDADMAMHLIEHLLQSTGSATDQTPLQVKEQVVAACRDREGRPRQFRVGSLTLTIDRNHVTANRTT